MLPSGWETCLLAKFCQERSAEFLKGRKKKGQTIEINNRKSQTNAIFVEKQFPNLPPNQPTSATQHHDWPLGSVGRYESYALFTFGLIVLEYLSQRLRRGLLPCWDFLQ